jgi:repressor LexA
MRVPANTLTPAQTRVLAYIRQCIEQGMPPTRSEIARHFGWRSPNAAEDHIRALCRKGVLAMTVPGASRGIRLVEPITISTSNDRDSALVGCYRSDVCSAR